MKFNTPIPSEPRQQRFAEVGDVYPAKGGRGDARYWLVVAVTAKRSAVVLGLDAEGQVVSGQTYGDWAFEDRPLLGRCSDIGAMSFDIEWVAQ